MGLWAGVGRCVGVVSGWVWYPRLQDLRGCVVLRVCPPPSWPSSGSFVHSLQRKIKERRLAFSGRSLARIMKCSSASSLEGTVVPFCKNQVSQDNSCSERPSHLQDGRFDELMGLKLCWSWCRNPPSRNTDLPACVPHADGDEHLVRLTLTRSPPSLHHHHHQ